MNPPSPGLPPSPRLRRTSLRDRRRDFFRDERRKVSRRIQYMSKSGRSPVENVTRYCVLASIFVELFLGGGTRPVRRLVSCPILHAKGLASRGIVRQGWAKPRCARLGA